MLVAFFCHYYQKKSLTESSAFVPDDVGLYQIICPKLVDDN